MRLSTLHVLMRAKMCSWVQMLWMHWEATCLSGTGNTWLKRNVCSMQLVFQEKRASKKEHELLEQVMLYSVHVLNRKRVMIMEMVHKHEVITIMYGSSSGKGMYRLVGVE